MDDNSKLPEGISYDELAVALLERLKPFLEEIIRKELAIINKDFQQEKRQIVRKSTMIATEPDIPDNGRYTVTQTAEVLRISRQTIDRHVKANLLIPNVPNKIKPTTSSQKRLIKTFSGKEIKRYWKNIY